MKVLVTGGAGFIGSHCADAFLKQGHEVVIVDNLSSGKRENIPKGTKFYCLDILDKRLTEVMDNERPDVICHHAAQVSVRLSVDDPVRDAEINIIGGIKMTNLAIAFGVKRFIFSSTGGAIYGEQDEFPAPESHPLRPLCPYGVSKLSFEKYLDYYRQEFGLQYCILRYSNVYGPRQDPFGEAGVVAIFSERFLEGKQPVINGDGEQTRDFVYVGDVARANVMALGLSGSRCFNISTGQETSINDIFGLLKDLTGSGLKEVHGPEKQGEQKRSVILPELAKKSIGWKPEVPLKEGLGYTVEYFRNQSKKQ
ncbi:MAG: NAD-dependent epimerase/dehydratase family protein [bacterium]